VREIPLDVDDIVFAPVASAQIALSKEDKEQGALVIDMGGGTTDYVLYVDGSIIATGCVPVGGDHVTNDIHLVTHVPFTKAEKVKITEGNAAAAAADMLGTIKIPDDKGFSGEEIKRELLNNLIQARLEETFEFVLEGLPKGWQKKVGSGVFLTGGASQMKGVGQLAFDMFDVPVQWPSPPEVSGSHAYFTDPKYATALGLIRYAQFLDQEKPSDQGGKLSGMIKSFWPF